jgi:hypothetical protein
MFFFGMIQNGPRGLGPILNSTPSEEEIDDITQYGVDWEDLDDPQIVAHHLEHNNADIATPFHNYGPQQLRN